VELPLTCCSDQDCDDGALQPHNVDLHYHAGQERQPGTSLSGYLEHAAVTGRIVLGVTDHLEKYIGSPLSGAWDPPLYPQNVAGLETFHADVDALRPQYPNMAIRLGPEIHAGPRIDLERIPQGIVDLSDYFMVSLPSDASSPAADTAAKIARIEAIAELGERTRRPVFIAHPFRSAVDRRLVKQPIEPWVTALSVRAFDRYTQDEVCRFFGCDVRALGHACAQHDVPIEVNGGTDGRIRGLNLPAPLLLLWGAYRLLQEEGATFVPGSDQHAYMRTAERREGRYVPFDAFAALGVEVEHMPLVSRLLNA
jgi:hypothetical protein